jgi:hypothetical protein
MQARGILDDPPEGAPFSDEFEFGSGFGRCRGWCERRPTQLDERGLHDVLADIGRVSPETVLRDVPRRQTFVWPGDPSVIVKRFEGGAFVDAWHDVRHVGFARSPARREAENLREMALAGLPVPRALGWCEEAPSVPLAADRRSAMWMERVEHRTTLREEGERDARAAVREWLVPLADLLAKLHRLGWYHRDAYLEHWIVSGERIVLLDVGRARREGFPAQRWFVKDVAALAHSCPAGVSRRARLRFLARYLDARFVEDRRERRAFARAVAAKARRIAAHAPRFVHAARTA